MTHLPLAVLGLVSTLALAACTPSGIDMSTPVSESGAAAHGRDGATYRTNPQPKQAYRITMTIADAPGPFASMRALAHYDVVNKDCLRPPKDNPGGYTSPVPTAPTEFALDRIADGVYAGVVYADLMLDEDYTGHGVCHWQLTSVVVQMKATGADGETLFVPSITDEKLLDSQPETVYFNKLSYFDHDDTYQSVDVGEANRSRFGPSIRDEDLFTVTFTPAREAAP